MENIPKNKVLVFTALFFVLLVSYGQTLKMNFWRDDYSMLFKLAHPLEQAGHFGKGLVGSGSYKYILIPHAPFYLLFKSNPLGYFVVGLLLYGVAMYAVYFLSDELLKNKKAAVFASLAFASGYIASAGLFRIINSWQNSYGQILVLLALWAYVKYFHEGKIRYYFLSLLLYFSSIEFVYVRSHGVIAAIIAADILLGFLPFLSRRVEKLGRELTKLTARLVPFGILFYTWYIKSGSPAVPEVGNRLGSLFTSGNASGLTPLFANVGNVLIPDKIQSFVISWITNLFFRSEPIASQVFWVGVLVSIFSFAAIYFFARLVNIPKKYLLVILIPFFVTMIANLQFYSQGLYWYKDTQTVTSGLLGMNSLVISLFVFVALWNKNRRAATTIFLGWIVIASQIFGYYIYYTDAILESTHRYLSHAFLGYCLILGGLASIFWSARVRGKSFKIGYVGLTLLALMILTNLRLNISSESRFVREVSGPSKDFYRKLLANVPRFEKGSLFYFDIQDNAFYQHQFDEFFSVGSMPNSTAIADYYGVDRYDFLLMDNYGEVLKLLGNKKVNLTQAYTFFYGAGGLKNTTGGFRNLLANGGKEVNGISTPIEFENKFTFNHELDSLAPIVFQMDVYPKGIFNKLGEQKPSGLKTYSLAEKLDFINYLKSKKAYYELAKATALSDWQYQKVGNILDNNHGTAWRGDRLYWNANHHDAVTVDLGRVNSVSKVIWVNWNHYFTPLAYTIETSVDQKTWKQVKRVEEASERKDGEVVVEEFPPSYARYIRMDITKTLTDDSPAISEIEAVESRYSGADALEADNFIKSPFAGTTDAGELKKIYTSFLPLAEISVSIEADKGKLNDVISIPVRLDQKGRYSGVIPAYGTSIKSVTLEIKNVPVLVSLYNLSFKNLSLGEIETRGLLKEFKEN